MKRKDTLKELRGLSEVELKEKASSVNHELMNLRFRHAAGQLSQTSQLKTLRRSAARVNSILSEKTKQQSA